MDDETFGVPVEVFAFGDQTYNAADVLSSLLQADEDPIVVDFLERSSGVLKYEVNRLASEQRAQCPRFASLADLVPSYRAGTLNPALVQALTCIAQLGTFLRYALLFMTISKAVSGNTDSSLPQRTQQRWPGIPHGRLGMRYRRMHWSTGSGGRQLRQQCRCSGTTGTSHCRRRPSTRGAGMGCCSADQHPKHRRVQVPIMGICRRWCQS